MRKWSLY